MSFAVFSRTVTRWAGSPGAFILAFASVAAWTVGGFVLGFTDFYQLVINTGTTIVTFLMVFVIQNSQNRDGAAIQAKLDEILRAVPKADDRRFTRIEEMPEEEIEALRGRLRPS